MDIDTGDTVRHIPTGEEWLVAGVEGDRLMWCGWPEGTAQLRDCELVEKAKPGERDKLLHELAAVNRNDRRACFARRVLRREADMKTEPVPVFAALATLRASKMQVWMARLFGKKVIGRDSGCVVTMHKWRGKFYLTNCIDDTDAQHQS